MQFLYALSAIIVIDLVLAGDNAVVIAMAARNLPADLRSRAILWGTAGAIVVRSLMTVAVVWLLKIPGLQMAGGALLLWIAFKLLAPAGEEGSAEHDSAMSFWGAMQTIVIADAVMGLDNVLAVAGAAHGNYLLVILGLLVSLPIVVWGSGMILKWIDRYPVIIYIGAGILAWTAAKMVLGEPLVQEQLGFLDGWHWLVSALITAAVMGAGYLRNIKAKRPQSTPAIGDMRGAAAAPPLDVVLPPVAPVEPLPALRNILLPVCDCPASRAAAEHLIAGLPRDGSVCVHVLHVVPRLSRHATRFLEGDARREWLRGRAHAAIDPVSARLTLLGINHRVHLRRGRGVAAAIMAVAQELRCERIVIGAARKSDLLRLVTGSVTGRVLAKARTPVEVVLHGEPSLIMRLGVPAGVGLAMFALMLEID